MKPLRMGTIRQRSKLILVAALLGLLASPALADKKGKGGTAPKGGGAQAGGGKGSGSGSAGDEIEMDSEPAKGGGKGGAAGGAAGAGGAGDVNPDEIDMDPDTAKPGDLSADLAQPDQA